MAEVGLALAILPLIISAAEHYRDIYVPFSRYRKFSSEAKKFQAAFLTQQAIYRNESVLLLRHAVSNTEAEHMIDNALHRLWKDASVEQNIVKSVGKSQGALHLVVWRIEQLLEEISKSQARWAGIFDDKDGEGDESERKAWRKRVSGKLKFAFSEDSLEKKVKELRRLIKDYQTLVNQSDRSAAALQRLDAVQEPQEPLQKELLRFEKVGETAKVLYDMLGDSCTKHTEHRTTISLAPGVSSELVGNVRFELAFNQRNYTPLSDDQQQIWFAVESRFAVDKKQDALSPKQDQRKRAIPSVHLIDDHEDHDDDEVDSTEQETHSKRSKAAESTAPNLIAFAPLPTLSSPALPNLCTGKNFCTQVHKYYKTAPLSKNGCIGVLEDHKSCKHLVYIDRPSLFSAASKQATLASLLQRIKGGESNFRLSQYGRVRFARILASAVLNFHTTPWLRNGHWRSGDISIFEPETLLDTILHNTKPFIDVAVRGRHHPPSRSVSLKARPFIQNDVLFGLGLILLELAFQKPLADMHLPSDMVMGNDDPYAEYAAAVRLSQVVSTELGSSYKKIVQKLLFCNFGTTFDLSDAELQRRYYVDVVSELEKLEEAFKRLQVG